jgi:hypothetical protein
LEIKQVFPFLLPNEPLSVAYQMLVSGLKIERLCFHLGDLLLGSSLVTGALYGLLPTGKALCATAAAV